MTAPPVAEMLDEAVAAQVAEARAHLDAIFDAPAEILAIIDADLLRERAVAQVKASILSVALDRIREREVANAS